jgi:CRP-like cAMP-binding protein
MTDNKDISNNNNQAKNENNKQSSNNDSSNPKISRQKTNIFKELLSKDPRQRKPADIGKIRQQLIKNDFFLKLDNIKRRKLCAVILYHSVVYDQHVYDKNRKADRIYFIQKGICKIVVSKSNVVQMVGPGEILGESCILDDTVYQETAIGESANAEFFVLLKKDYLEICYEERKKLKLINQNVMLNISWFKHFKVQAIQRILYYSTVYTGEFGTCIFKEGKPVHSILFVVQGCIDVRKRILPNIVGGRPTTPSHGNDAENESNADVQNSKNNNSEVFSIAELHDGDFFGIYDSKVKPAPLYTCNLYISKRCKYILIPIQCFETSINIQGLIPLFRQLFLIDEQRHKLWDLHFNARKRLYEDSIVVVEETVDMFQSKVRENIDSITAKSPPVIVMKGEDKTTAHQSWVYRMNPRKKASIISLDKLDVVEKESQYLPMYQSEAEMKYEREERLHRKNLKCSSNSLTVKKAMVQEMVEEGKFKVKAKLSNNEAIDLIEHSVRDNIPVAQRIDDLVIATEIELNNIDTALRKKLEKVKLRRIKQNKKMLQSGKGKDRRRRWSPVNSPSNSSNKLKIIKSKSQIQKEKKIQAVLNSIEDLNKEIHQLSPNLPVKLNDLKKCKRGERPFANGVAALAALKLAGEEKSTDPIIPKRWVAESPHRSKDPTLLNNFVKSMNTGLTD